MSSPKCAHVLGFLDHGEGNTCLVIDGEEQPRDFDGGMGDIRFKFCPDCGANVADIKPMIKGPVAWEDIGHGSEVDRFFRLGNKAISKAMAASFIGQSPWLSILR